MTKRNILIFLVTIVVCYQVTAQQTAAYTSDLVEYQKALSLYNNKQYLAAQSLFFQVKKTAKEEVLQSDCAYHIANCAVRLNQQNADQLIENFVKDYPTSTKRNTAYVDVGDTILKTQNMRMLENGTIKLRKNHLREMSVINSILIMVILHL